MQAKSNSIKMKARSESGSHRHMIISVCGTVTILIMVSFYYSSFFSSRLHRQSGGDAENDWPQDTHLKLPVDSSSNKEDATSHHSFPMKNKHAQEKEQNQEVEQEQEEEQGRQMQQNPRSRKEISDEDEVESTIGKDVDLDEHFNMNGDEGIDEVTLKRFPICDSRYTELIPCLDRNVLAQLKIKLNTSLMEHYERHCPPSERRLNCLIPPPPDYKVPIKWPASRDKVWRANVPHSFLATEKSDQHWMVIKGDKVIFPGGGTHFHDGADKYIASLGKMLKNPDGNLSLKGKIRTVLDVGCGVASFGAYLLPLNILALSLAPNDVHENQIQFALERGIPSTLGVLGTKRLPYPSKSFDLIHCSRCRIDWLERDGILLLEINRLLRAGGYFAWSSPPAYRDDEEDRKIWNDMNDFANRICWSIAAKEGQTVIWAKPKTNKCYRARPKGTKPPMCSIKDDPDAAWQEPMKVCIAPLSQFNDRAHGSGLLPWPARLVTAPPRLKELGFDEETFREDTALWQKRVEFYWTEFKSEVSPDSLRNVMDMRAHFGGFAAALVEKPVWVMNVVPSSGPNTLKVIYDRGLIGTSHNWCESFSTYPRTFDMLHAWGIFSEVKDAGCSMEDLLLEMDRILRPKGLVIIRDTSPVINQVKKYLSALHWDAWNKEILAERDALSDKEEVILLVRKNLWQPDDTL